MFPFLFNLLVKLVMVMETLVNCVLKACGFLKMFVMKIPHKMLKSIKMGQVCKNALTADKNGCYTERLQDMIGPKYPGNSNVRQVQFRKVENESDIETKYRLTREETENWHVQYWESHNSDFKNMKKIFIAETVLKKQQEQEQNNEVSDQTSETTIELNADEMSVFYKQYLRETQSKHLQYNRDWYKRNFYIVYLSVMVNFFKLFHPKKLKK